MFPEIDRFTKWLRCRSPQATTHVHYASDARLFFTWVDKLPAAITLHDVDAYSHRAKRSTRLSASSVLCVE